MCLLKDGNLLILPWTCFEMDGMTWTTCLHPCIKRSDDKDCKCCIDKKVTPTTNENTDESEVGNAKDGGEKLFSIIFLAFRSGYDTRFCYHRLTFRLQNESIHLPI